MSCFVPSYLSAKKSSEFNEVKQGNDEDLRKFHDRVLQLYWLANPDRKLEELETNEQLIGAFLRGLNRDSEAKRARPGTYTAALELAARR